MFIFILSTAVLFSFIFCFQSCNICQKWLSKIYWASKTSQLIFDKDTAKNKLVPFYGQQYISLLFVSSDNNNARLTILCPGLPWWASTRKVKPVCILLKQETVAVASAGPCGSLHVIPSRQITINHAGPCQHPTNQFFTGQVPFLPPRQQRQSPEG